MCIRDRFEGQLIDLSEGWGEAQACVVWDSDQLVECFRTEDDLTAHMAASALQPEPGELGILSTCASSLKLYDGLSYSVSYTHLRAHETVLDLVCRLLLEKKKK